MNQIGSIKRIDQYQRIYVPKKILDDLELEKESHCVWVETDFGYTLKKVNVSIEE